MRWIFPSLALGLLAVAAPLAAQESPPAPAYAVPRDRLPVLGTVGDLPPVGERVIVEIANLGSGKASLVIGGKPVDLFGFGEVVNARAKALQEGTGTRLNVVLRVDRAVRWAPVRGIMALLSMHGTPIRRVFFAAVPEDGGEEGAMAAFLPLGEIRDREGAEGPRFLDVRLLADRGSAAPGPVVHARLAGAKPAAQEGGFVAALAGDGNVSVGAVLETMDALLRSGVRGVALALTGGPKEEPPADPAIGWPRVQVGGRDAEGPSLAGTPLPRIARVRGSLAGQVESPPSPPGPESNSIGIGGRRVRSRGDGKARLLEREGGAGTEDAVAAGLDWLARHVTANGYWDADGFEAYCKGAKCGGPGGPLYDPGITGLSLLAFLGTGETHKSAKFGHWVRNGLKYLKGIQDAEGCFGPRTSHHFVYNHAIATLAMADAYAQTESPLFKQPAQSGLDFIKQCRNPYLAWRYGVQPKDNDTSVTAWMVWALDVGRNAGLDVDPEAFAGAKAWLDKVTDPATGRAGYTLRGNGPARPQELMDRFPADRSESLTALAVLTRLNCDRDQGDPMVKKGLDLLSKVPPAWSTRDGTIDFYYWHFATRALFDAGGEGWRAWNEAMKKALVDHQRRVPQEDARGSWDPADPWASEGGRVYATALNTLTLETYYRYPPRRFEK